MGRNKTSQTDKQVIMNFSKELKRLLKKAHISQIQMKRDLNLGKTSINNWATGKAQPQLVNLRAIILYLMSKIELKDFYPIQLLVPEFDFDESSPNEIRVNEIKNDIQSEYNKKCQEIEQLKEQINDLKSKINQRRMYYDEKINDLDEEKERLNTQRKILEEEKKSYKEKIRFEEIKKIDNDILKNIGWFPDKLVEKILSSRIISNLINKISISESIIYEDILEQLKSSIVVAVRYQIYNYLRGIEEDD